MALIPGGSQSPIMEIFGQIDGAPLAAAYNTAALSYSPLCMHWQTITSGKMWWNAPKIIKNLGDPSWRSGLVAVTRNFLLETWEVSAAGVGQEKFSHEGAAKLFLILILITYGWIICKLQSPGLAESERGPIVIGQLRVDQEGWLIVCCLTAHSPPCHPSQSP